MAIIKTESDVRAVNFSFHVIILILSYIIAFIYLKCFATHISKQLIDNIVIGLIAFTLFYPTLSYIFVLKILYRRLAKNQKKIILENEERQKANIAFEKSSKAEIAKRLKMKNGVKSKNGVYKKAPG